MGQGFHCMAPRQRWSPLSQPTLRRRCIATFPPSPSVGAVPRGPPRARVISAPGRLPTVQPSAAASRGQPGNAHGFRFRATDQAGHAGSYPVAAATATQVGTQSGQADLRVANLSVTPNPKGGALARVTVINDSGVATQRG